MQTRGVCGQKIPKNANIICEGPLKRRERMPHKLVFGKKIKSPTIVRQAASWARRQARILFTAWQVQ